MPKLAEILKQLQKGSEDGTVIQMRQPTELVFRTAWGKPISYDNLQLRGIRKASEVAGLHREGLPNISCHDLRHSFASVLIRSGLDIYSISRQLGHSKVSTTLDLYAGEFEKAKNSEAIRDHLSAAFGGQ